MKVTLYAAFCLAFFTPLASASEGHGNHASPYTGLKDQPIKSLSSEDIAELRRGGGWGLAKAAELNGVPGPLHLLDMKNEISLTPDQVEAITGVFASMRTSAIVEGEKLIALESELEQGFQNRTITVEALKQLLGEIAQVRSALRYVHLSAHLETPGILEPEQIENYNRLRGYSSSEPCAPVPNGHDAAMWRRHHGCESPDS